MTQNYHTPIAYGAPAQSAVINAPLAELDQAITNLNNGVGIKYTVSQSQTLSTGVESEMEFDEEIHDPNNLFDGIVFQAPAPGGYLILTMAKLDASAAWNAAEHVKQRFLVNGSPVDGNYMALSFMQAAANTPVGVSGIGLAILDTNDELSVSMVQNSGSSVTIGADPGETWIAIVRVF